MSAFVISKRFNGEFKFTFANRKGKTIFTSFSLKKKSDCELIINAIRENFSDFTITRKKKSGKHFFRISKGGLVLANSRKFSTELMLEKGLDQIVKYVEEAETLDFSESENVFEDPEPVAEGES